jgi:hypothetical protein
LDGVGVAITNNGSVQIGWWKQDQAYGKMLTIFTSGVTNEGELRKGKWIGNVNLTE